MGTGESDLPVPAPPAVDEGQRSRRKRRVAVGIGLALAGLAATVAVPNWMSAHLNSNESAAIATLKNISSAQAQIQASGIVDPDGDGQGSYGFFSEMAGTVAVRGRPGAPPLHVSPPVISAKFGSPRNGRVHRGGYVFEIFLPAEDGAWANEQDVRNGRALDESKCETLWLCYCWPESYDWSGRRAFMVNERGDVLMTKNVGGSYDGENGPRAGAAAFLEPVHGAKVAANCEDCEGDPWTVV